MILSGYVEVAICRKMEGLTNCMKLVANLLEKDFMGDLYDKEQEII